MDHYTEKFKFIDIHGAEREVESVPYSFKIEKILVERFGQESIDEFLKTHVFNHRLKINEVQEDMTRLLELGDFEIDFTLQEGKYFDELKRAYFFFIEYDSNASLRQSQQLKETLASSIATLKTTLSSMPEGFSPDLNLMNIVSK